MLRAAGGRRGQCECRNCDGGNGQGSSLVRERQRDAGSAPGPVPRRRFHGPAALRCRGPARRAPLRRGHAAGPRHTRCDRPAGVDRPRGHGPARDIVRDRRDRCRARRTAERRGAGRPGRQHVHGAPLVPDAPAGLWTAVARTGADGRQDGSVPVLAVAGDPRPLVDSNAGHAAAARDLHRPDPRATRAARRDEREQRSGGADGWRVPLRHAAADSFIPDRDRGRTARVARARAAHGDLRGATADRRRGARVRRHGKDAHGLRDAVRSVSLGTVRPAGPAAFLSLRRDGESAPDLPHADGHRRRPQPGRADRA